MSGLIFVVLALAWALYLIPKALRHHDEIARTRSIDRFSNAMRVLARREPVNRRDARLVVTPRRRTERILVPGASGAPGRKEQSTTERTGSSSRGTGADVTESTAGAASAASVARPVARPAVNRAAARSAAKRRRRILSVLLLADAATVTVAALGLAPWWTVAIPGGLTLLYLLLCRTLVRRERRALVSARRAAPAAAPVAPVAEDVEPRRAVRVDVSSGVVAVRNAQGFEEVSADEDTITIPATALTAAVAAGSVAEADAAAARAVVTVEAETAPTTAEQGGSLWDPLPMTLPTYVTKPRAPRTVRTIDLMSAPDTWTSGHTEEDSKLVEEAEAAQQEQSEVGPDEQRAVGS